MGAGAETAGEADGAAAGMGSRAKGDEPCQREDKGHDRDLERTGDLLHRPLFGKSRQKVEGGCSLGEAAPRGCSGAHSCARGAQRSCWPRRTACTIAPATGSRWSRCMSLQRGPSVAEDRDEARTERVRMRQLAFQRTAPEIHLRCEPGRARLVEKHEGRLSRRRRAVRLERDEQLRGRAAAGGTSPASRIRSTPAAQPMPGVFAGHPARGRGGRSVRRRRRRSGRRARGS